MDPHLIELPRTVLIGNGVLGKLPGICRELGAEKNILVLTDSVTKKIAGERIREMVNGSLEIVDDSTLAEAGRISKLGNPGLVISAGGGRIIDVGKKIAQDVGCLFISVPTAPSHDGIASERASLTGQNGTRRSIRTRPPAAIIADISILRNAPYELIASGAADAVSNCTAVEDWRLARDENGEYYSEYAASMALLSSEIVIKSARLIHEKKERGIRNLVEALVSSGISMSLVGSSIPASGSEHAFSHALDAMAAGSGTKRGLHGQQCGLGSILMSYWQGQDWERIRDSLRELGSPVTAQEIGIEKETIIKALVNARGIRKRYTILDKKPLDRKKALDICRATGVFS
jgi:glycerol-1-phosphate dehydrogenase [NAD(P)+]